MSFLGRFFGVSTLAIATAATMYLGGCSSATNTNPFAGLLDDAGGIHFSGDGGKSDGSSASSGQCGAFCQKAASASCPKQSTCESDCQKQVSQTPSDCQSQLDAMLSCATSSKGSFAGCGSSGKPTLKGCDSEALAYAACLQGSSGTKDGGTTTTQDSGTSGSCGLQLNPASCDTCFRQSCCSQGNACANNSECAAIITCFGTCAANDTTCANNCVNAHPNGEAALQAVDQCLSNSCNAQCQ